MPVQPRCMLSTAAVDRAVQLYSLPPGGSQQGSTSATADQSQPTHLLNLFNLQL